MTKSELVELNASEMEAISAGYQGRGRRPGLGGLIVLLLLALLLRGRTAAPAAEAAA